MAALSSGSFGSPVYSGPPDTATASALIFAGGGPKVYGAKRAYNTILGVQLVDPEIEYHLQRHYGEPAVATWMRLSTFIIKDAERRSTAVDVHLPLPPGPLVGLRLMKALVRDGTAPDGAFWTGYWLDKLFSHAVHVAVMHDVDERFGTEADATFNRVNNQALYDIDHQIGGAVGLASFR